jgi:Hypothetical glycosyl hydrolase family 15
MRIAIVHVLASGIAFSAAAAGCGKGGGAAAGGASSTASSTATATASSTATSTASASASSSSSGTGGGGTGVDKFPDTSASIAVLADQLPGGLTPQQQQFAATHYVGTQKLTLDLSAPLKAINPKFLVLHYHLAMWQSAPNVTFIVDGKSWGNDYNKVNPNESWFWHNTSNQRVASVVDGKLLMNVSDPGFQTYWIESLTAQTQAGDYDGIFLDSASPALLQWEAQSPPEPRFDGTGVKDNILPELGNKTFIQAWEAWIATLQAALASKGIPLIPNTGAFITSWDDTAYDLTAGIFSEGYADPSFAESDWKASTNELLSLAKKGKIMILQNYLKSPGELDKRRYYLGNYLLVRGEKSYLDYFAAGPFEWYPEWGLDLGAASTTGATVDDLLKDGVYQRDFAKGLVLVNPSDAVVTVPLPGTMKRVEPMGGGPVDMTGAAPGTIGTSMVSSIDVPAKGAEILLK